MQIKNIKRWATPGPEAYLVGLLGFMLAFSVRYALAPFLDDHLSMLFFAINSLVIAFLYGFWPSFLMLVISLPTALYFFTKPFYTFGPVNDQDIFLFLVYFSLILSTALMFEWLRREQYKARLLARVSETRYRLLVESDEDRRAALRANTTET